MATVSRVEILQFITETPLTVTLVVRRRAARLEQTEGGQDDPESDSVMPGYALQTCKRSVVHDGFELRQVTVHKLTTDTLGLQVQRQSLDSRTYYQVILLHFSIF